MTKSSGTKKLAVPENVLWDLGGLFMFALAVFFGFHAIRARIKNEKVEGDNLFLFWFSFVIVLPAACFAYVYALRYFFSPRFLSENLVLSFFLLAPMAWVGPKAMGLFLKWVQGGKNPPRGE